MDSPHPASFSFINETPLRVLVQILKDWDVRIPAALAQSLSREDLERRVKILLSDSQRLKEVLPLSKTKYALLDDYEMKSVTKTAADTVENTKKGKKGKKSSKPKGTKEKSNSLPQIFANSHTLTDALLRGDSLMNRQRGVSARSDVIQTLIDIATAVESNRTDCFILQDDRHTSAICIKVTSVKLSRDVPVVFVLFYHETTGCTDITKSSPAVKWIEGQATKLIDDIGCSVEEQHVLLRLLLYNASRLPADFNGKANRSKLEKDFAASFYLPLDPLTTSALHVLSGADGCLGDNCRNAGGMLCSGCGTARYCSSSCQEAHWAAHEKLCGRVSESEKYNVTVSAHPFPQGHDLHGGGMYMSSMSRMMSQRDMGRVGTHKVGDNIKQFNRVAKTAGTASTFVVKVQIPGAGMVKGIPDGAMRVYDADRTFDVFIHRGDKGNDAGYVRICELAEKNTRWRGAKIFMYARFTGEEGMLEILTDALPGQELQW